MTSSTAYATRAEFDEHGLSEDMTVDVPDALIAKKLLAASRRIDGILRARGFMVPLESWDLDLTWACCKLAAVEVLFATVGANPADPAHAMIVEFGRQAQEHVEKVAKGVANLSTSEPTRKRSMTARVFSAANCDGTRTRGW